MYDQVVAIMFALALFFGPSVLFLFWVRWTHWDRKMEEHKKSIQTYWPCLTNRDWNNIKAAMLPKKPSAANVGEVTRAYLREHKGKYAPTVLLLKRNPTYQDTMRAHGVSLDGREY